MIPKAEWLDIILYSKEQVDLENEAMNESFELNAPWGIVSIKVCEIYFFFFSFSLPISTPLQPLPLKSTSLYFTSLHHTFIISI
jgi:hypothetical protein